jgi:hypothetical protein
MTAQSSSELNTEYEDGNPPDGTARLADGRLDDASIVVNGFAHVEHRENHRDRDENRRIRKYSSYL